jgi:hypothetical protein
MRRYLSGGESMKDYNDILTAYKEYVVEWERREQDDKETYTCECDECGAEVTWDKPCDGEPCPEKDCKGTLTAVEEEK